MHILTAIVETLGVLLVGGLALLGATRWTWKRQFRSVPAWQEHVTRWFQAVSHCEAQDPWLRLLTRTVLGPIAEEIVFRGIPGLLVLEIPIQPGLWPALTRISLYVLGQVLWVYAHVGEAAQIARRYPELPVMPAGAMVVSLRRLSWHSLVLSAVWWVIWAEWYPALTHGMAKIPWVPVILATVATGILHVGWNTLVLRTDRREILRRIRQWSCPWTNEASDRATDAIHPT